MREWWKNGWKTHAKLKVANQNYFYIDINNWALKSKLGLEIETSYREMNVNTPPTTGKYSTEFLAIDTSTMAKWCNSSLDILVRFVDR